MINTEIENAYIVYIRVCDERHFPDSHTHDSNLLPHLITMSGSDAIVIALFMLYARALAK